MNPTEPDPRSAGVTNPQNRRIEFRTGDRPAVGFGPAAGAFPDVPAREAQAIADAAPWDGGRVADPLTTELAARQAAVRDARSILLWTVAGLVSLSLALEWGGWQIVFKETPALRAAGIPFGAFLRGASDTALGAIGLGTLGAVATLAFPATWRRPWRRVALGFAAGTGAFLAFLSLLTAPAIW